MLFCLHIQDKPDRVETRKQFVDEHRAYQKDCGVDVTLSGPLLAEDGGTMIGSIFFIEAPDRAGVEKFIANDPFTRNDVWGESVLTRFLRRHG
ncbi:MAG: YciI family protein [Alphaproteobacteria bacterium]|nr:YciI family protein [Alphaproteobacteria bacterium]